MAATAAITGRQRGQPAAGCCKAPRPRADWPPDRARSGGFPTIWAQNIKDVVLHHAGPPVTAIPAIAEQATKDLGFTVQMQATENADLLNRFLSQSSAIDCADVSITYMKYLVGRGILQTIPLAKVKHWDQTIPLFTRGDLSRRTRGVAAGRRALHRGLCRRSRLDRGSPPNRPSG